MFFATVFGSYLPLLLTVCLPFVFLFIPPQQPETVLQGDKTISFVAEPDHNDTPAPFIYPLSGTTEETLVVRPVFCTLTFLPPEEGPAPRTRLLNVPGNRAPPVI